jgi:UDP-GlcNAc:undecaprenyl-phosphate GlcNAc-1-phosphate transferase
VLGSELGQGNFALTLFYLGIFAASLLLSFVLTRVVRNFATIRGWVSAPALERHLHTAPLPRLGGVAIFVSFTLVTAVSLIAGHFAHSLNVGVPEKLVLAVLFPGFLIFLLGVYDDIYSVGPYVKFTVQGIAGAIVYASGLRILNLPVLFGHHHFSNFIGFPLTILWILAITNAFNLIDGLDGLSAGSALFSTLVVFVVALFSSSTAVSLMSLALAGAILGFLRFNFNPATIFLGDCGSLFIGFTLSALALYGAEKSPTTIAVAIPVVSFGLPILETVLSMLRRFISGRPVFTADREHIHHKLLQLGLSHRQVVIVLYAVSAVFAMLSLFLLWPTGSTLGLVLLVLGSGIWIGVQHLGYLEFGEIRRIAHRTIEQRQISINNLSIRRALKELKVAGDYAQLCRILTAAFGNNDFDGFELLPSASLHLIQDRELEAGFCWRKLGNTIEYRPMKAWSITLDLITANNRRTGSMTIYRRYCERNLQLDINLLTADFPIVLAEALERVSLPAVQFDSAMEETAAMAIAQAG